MSANLATPDETPRKRGKSDEDKAAARELKLRALIRECALSEGIEDAVAAVLEELDSMPELNQFFREQAAGDMIYKARNNIRAQMERQSNWTVPENASNAVAARQAARLSLYDWPLPNSDVRLGDATVDDLQAAAEFHDYRAAEERKRHFFYAEIASLVKKSKKPTVRAALAEDKLREIMRGVQ